MAKVQSADAARRMPTQERSRRTFATILDAAAQILERNGEDAVLTNAVAERSGFSIGTLYQYFPDRDAILVALAERERRRIAHRMTNSLGKLTAGEGSDTLREFVGALIQSFAKRRGAKRQFALMVSMMTMRGNDRVVGTPADEFSTILIDSWSRLGIGRGDGMDRIDAFVLTRAVLGVLRSAALENASFIEEKRFEDALVALIMSFNASKRGSTGQRGSALIGAIL